MHEESFDSGHDGVQKIITEAKNICIIPSHTNEPESLPAALALFYTLKDLGKNVNLINESFPEKLQFLIPSLDFLSQPKNFVISIPRSVADISQIYYEKSEDHLKIHLTIQNSRLKKENISFYVDQPKPDLVITLGVQDFQQELTGRLDSFGFILNAPILNIDNTAENTRFGKINIIKECSLAELLLEIASASTASKETANCLLAGMVAYYENFKSAKTQPDTLKTAARLMEQGANYHHITENLYKTTPQQMEFLTEIFKNVKNEQGSYVAQLQSQQFFDFGEVEASLAMEKINGLGLQNNLLVLWKSHASPAMIKGFFSSKNVAALHKINGKMKQGWVFLEFPGSNIEIVKDKLLTLIQ
ncbi:MAG: hypothetical protein A3C50_00475 [Candidatus Staskawiczbacteria bacterium RIFCSPHIGHO2_02_FULL_43_16]|uniref:DHHA1 domain-containing protein n=1 Tax=Candidatus Staskawiczbacteria bacterium RIFCSPHIGHO2_01_FULL_41_41 TaxID=1802203 RepID=A0A1G2HVN2_9BACT|nr:MAG: hypothetical protein A2822_02140 [Candidatus Staskawiczbacteria bacterium RIFCSPHIGHO2_01_FULL_41_41]OGZ68958.1 MAG: hypothetical protein A3C50_00475 [Candidatus Staskawiczbacteria bacterium RIFCSPHIGHO2_02_FULL_43_16]OGZ74860.1 MAG: hypothetical protein A3A12_03340 [Candidatus Staskawiczbacteria bacterium RIFCSPLOWO2_01_FULL_43_17b]